MTGQKREQPFAGIVVDVERLKALDSKGRHPLLSAMHSGQIDAISPIFESVKRLPDRDKTAIWTQCDHDGYNILMVAAKKYRKEVAYVITTSINNDELATLLKQRRSKDGYTACMIAMTGEHPNSLFSLLHAVPRLETNDKIQVLQEALSFAVTKCPSAIGPVMSSVDDLNPEEKIAIQDLLINRHMQGLLLRSATQSYSTTTKSYSPEILKHSLNVLQLTVLDYQKWPVKGCVIDALLKQGTLLKAIEHNKTLTKIVWPLDTNENKDPLIAKEIMRIEGLLAENLKNKPNKDAGGFPSAQQYKESLAEYRSDDSPVLPIQEDKSNDAANLPFN